MHDELPTDIRAYHQRSKHFPQRYAAGPAFLDWDTQPDPFRRFAGSRTVSLPLRLEEATPPFDRLGRLPPRPLTAESLGLFLELALGLSAWKEIPGSRWALRNNPSSGNLHPTEGWVVLPPLPALGEAAALYHYAPAAHALEERRRFAAPPDLPAGGFLLALSSVAWRESWKYGERAFRYCQHDVGHALAGAAYAAACLGWRLRLLTAPGDETLAALLGLDRPESAHRYEEEHGDLLAVVSPAPLAALPALPTQPMAAADGWSGRANRLSEDHEPWLAVERAWRLCRKPVTAEAIPPDLPPRPALPAAAEPAGAVIRRRRSAQRMDGETGIGRDAFFRLLAATLPGGDGPPWNAVPWAPRLALMLFVHRVEGLAPGLYALPRDPDSLPRLRAACDPGFAWTPVTGCPLPLYQLSGGDLRRLASALSCQQAIAGHGAFSLGMLADFARTLDEEGDWAYRRLFWEAGMIGQVLYLEATAAGLSGTGIGCYYDDEMHRLLGLPAAGEARGLDWQSLYHFTVGKSVEDARLTTLPPYGERA